ncbi:Maph120 [Matsumuraeses phaseoli granulovirus]|uniref:Maph120 n=1 Tax=Matsumuraeses phaseoli granulovirus TaxID=2760664 RepID=A0AAE7MLH3_9BBAC|nr:Maph120 [Matsumuraeses phaseoli granulovirus]QOD40083.1 Maph120 [Matsumuraeses phaseoli granulovirus]
MVFITTETECKSAAESIINNQFVTMECAICLNEIDKNNKGVIYITCGGTADLERAMCRECDKRLEKQDPYKRNIEYRFEYPFINDEHTKSFLNKSKTFVLNEGEEEKIEAFSKALKNTVDGYQDVEYSLKLILK